ncbi:MAG TPA: ABC transporter permease [Longimicrobiales bacterium]|jgi:putative ABC transport system permease protein
MMGARRPPRLARALLELLLPPSDRGTATGDLDEEYTRFVLPERGRLHADFWYWRQVLLSIPRLIERPSATSGLGADVRQAFRVICKRPAFAFATIATLGLGLGLNTAVFSVVHAVLLTPLPYGDAERVVRPIPDELFFVNSYESVALGERMTTLDGTAAWSRTLALFDEAEAEEVRGASVSWNHFDLLRARPLYGRSFTREDAARGDGVILGHGLWVRRFGADPRIVGRTVRISGEATTVLGVMASEYVPLEFDWEVWFPMPLDPAEMEGRGIVVNGRLRDGVTLEQSREELRRVLGDIWIESGGEVSDEDRAGLEMVTIQEWMFGDVRSSLWAVGAGVVFLLLLACANVANLLLVHTATRAREFAVRSALGGSRLRVGRQLATEIFVLAVAGGLVGYGAAALSLGWLVSRLPDDLPRLTQIGLSGGVTVYALGSALVVATLIGLAPVVRATGRSVGSRLTGGRGSSSGRAQIRLRGGLVALEMALAVLLVSGAGLMMRSLVSLQGVDTGFDAEDVVTLRPSPPADRYPTGAPLEQYYAQLTERLQRLPGVTSVGAIQFLPMTSGGWWASYQTEETQASKDAIERRTAMRVVRDGYFETMGMRLIRGRLLTGEDFAEGAPSRALVNATFVHEAGADVLGRAIYIDGSAVEVVGIVGDVRQSDLRTDSHAETYIAFARVPWRRMHMVVRVDGDPGATMRAARAAVVALDPRIAVSGPTRMSEIVARTMGRTTLVVALLSLFGFVGLGLGGVGIYGVATQAVAEQRRDIGIRLALGAQRSRVTTRAIVRGLVPVCVGLGVGLAAAQGGSRLLDDLLFGVSATDLATLVAAPSTLVLVALGALAIPAIRAGRVDPARTLREE